MLKNKPNYRGSLLDKLQKSKKLPLGHVGRKEAEEKVNREYEKAYEQEVAFLKQLPKRFRRSLEPDRAREVVSTLCSLTGTREPKIVFASLEVHPMAAAHCAWKELHFRWGNVPLSLVIHELAHHVNNMDKCGGGHGESFLWTEQFLFDLFMREVLPEWKRKEQGL